MLRSLLLVLTFTSLAATATPEGDVTACWEELSKWDLSYMTPPFQKAKSGGRNIYVYRSVRDVVAFDSREHRYLSIDETTMQAAIKSQPASETDLIEPLVTADEKKAFAKERSNLNIDTLNLAFPAEKNKFAPFALTTGMVKKHDAEQRAFFSGDYFSTTLRETRVIGGGDLIGGKTQQSGKVSLLADGPQKRIIMQSKDPAVFDEKVTTGILNYLQGASHAVFMSGENGKYTGLTIMGADPKIKGKESLYIAQAEKVRWACDPLIERSLHAKLLSQKEAEELRWELTFSARGWKREANPQDAPAAPSSK